MNPYEDQMEKLKEVYTNEFLDDALGDPSSLYCVFCKKDYPNTIHQSVHVFECVFVCVWVRMLVCVCVCICAMIFQQFLRMHGAESHWGPVIATRTTIIAGSRR